MASKVQTAFRKYFPKHPKEILVAEDDAIHFSIAHPKTLPWFASVLAPVHEHGHSHHQHGAARQVASQHQHSESNSLEEKENARIRAMKLRSADGEPPLKRAHESTVIQLFYDLFFVANLTTFTSVHEINDSSTLKSYVGFFSVLWFTWLQVALFDIRFGVDSVIERICKGLQFGVMTGFAVVGPAYEVGMTEEPEKAAQVLRGFQTLSLILMASRLILCAQYGIVSFWLRSYKKTLLPMFIQMLVLFSSAMIFLGLYFSFGREFPGDNSLVGWYVTVGVEAAIVLLLSAKYKFLSFRKTCIVERLGLLTLIILGEGVIGLCGTIQKVGSDQQFGSDIIGMIICGVVIIYAQWMLYFDQTEVDRVGTVRQLVWTILHLPYHVSILLLVEGVSQLSVWRKLMDYWDMLLNQMIDLPFPETVEEIPEAVQRVNETLQEFFLIFDENLGKLKFDPPYIDDGLTYLGELWNATFTEAANGTAVVEGTSVNVTDQIGDQLSNLFAAGANFAAESFGVEPPEGAHASDGTTADYLTTLINTTFNTIFIYMFICAGLSLILTSILFFFGKRHKVRGDYLNIFFRIMMGLGLALLSIMGTSNRYDYQWSYSVYASSAWALPTVTIVFAVVVVVDNLLINYVRHLVKRDHNYTPAQENFDHV